MNRNQAKSARAKNNRHVYAILSEAKITASDDKHLLVSALLGVEVTSLADLTDTQMADLATALQDWRTVEHARRSTGAGTIAAIEHLLRLVPDPGLERELLKMCSNLGLTVTGMESEPTHDDHQASAQSALAEI